MLLLANVNGRRLRAEQAGSCTYGTCPWTGKQVKAKVGEIRQYWVYVGGEPERPEGYENESEWHIKWKEALKDDFCEVVCGDDNEHRADIFGNDNTVIEIQRSPIDIRIVRERTNFYKDLSNKRVVWVVDASEYWKTRLKVNFEKKVGSFYLVEWKPVRQWVVEIAKTTNSNLFLDFNPSSDKLFKMWVYKKQLVGTFLYKVDFFKNFLSENAKDEFKNDHDKFLEIWK